MLQSRLWSKGDAGNIMLIADRIDLHVLVLSHKIATLLHTTCILSNSIHSL